MEAFVVFSFVIFFLLYSNVHGWENNKLEEEPPVVSESGGSCTTNGEFRPHPSDCNKYLVCDNVRLVEQSCPAGLHWNAAVNICDWPQNANCNPKKPPTRPTAPPKKPPPPPTKTPPPTPPPTRPPPSSKPSTSDSGEFKVVCYYTNWAFYRKDAGKYLPENVDPNLCTHIIYAFAALDPASLTMKVIDSWADVDNKFYEKVTAFRQQGKKVLIAIGGWTDSQGDKYGRLLTDPNARRNFITKAVEFIKQYNFDGLDLDLEYPACWQGNCEPGRAAEKAGYAQLIQELSEAFKPHGFLLTAAVSASPKVIDAAYDVPKMAKYLDFISLMTYDYHGSYDGKTGHNAPLHSSDPSDNLNVDYSVHYWIEKGSPSSKLVMGIPAYGRSFTLADPNNNGFNAPSSGPGQAGPFTAEGGSLSYYEICDKTKKNGWKVVRDPENKIGPYAYHGNQWVSFDDVDNVRTKSKLIREWKLGGGMIWSLDFDDFTGSCGCGKYPLLTAMNQELRGVGGNAVNNCT